MASTKICSSFGISTGFDKQEHKMYKAEMLDLDREIMYLEG